MAISRRALLASAAAPLIHAQPRGPNILWISIEDSSPQLGCYGDPLAITPNVDRLAAQGTRFTNAYSVIGVCAPSRSSIITGVHASTLGTQHMRCNAAPPDHIKCFPEYLRQAGYFCTNNSKTDYNFPAPKTAWDQNGNRAHWKNRPAGAPFFAVFNLLISHESQILHRGAAHEKATRRLTAEQRRDPAKVSVPPYYIDTPEVRRDLANIHDNLTQMDYEAGDLLAELSAAGLDEDTIVFFWADHGVGMPRSKRWLYQSSTHVPLIVRIPDRFRTGAQGRPASVNSELVSLLDLGPTALNLAGVPVPAHMHGRAFLGGNLTPPRRFVYGFRDRMDERYDLVRSVFDGRYRYIRNFDFHQPHYQYMNTSEENATMAAMRSAHEAGTLPPQVEKYFHPKPAEELYEPSADPHEMNNLARSPAHRQTLETMRAELRSWMIESKDLGVIAEAELEPMGRRHGSRYQILRAPENAGLPERLLVLADAARDGKPKPLLEALAHPEPAVRCRAALGLGQFNRLPSGAAPKLRRLLNDASGSVRIAAARTLAAPESVIVLRKELDSPDETLRLNAALALDELGKLAMPALDDLRKHIDADPYRYVGRVANHAVNGLTGQKNKVSGGFSPI